MPYSVQHIRTTLECDACGRIETRDFDSNAASAAEMISGWGIVQLSVAHFCCPACLERVREIIFARERACEKGRNDV